MSRLTVILSALLAAFLAGTSAGAAELGIAPARHHGHVQRITLPRERHVIEVVAPPYSGAFIINGTSFLAQSPVCLRWTANEPVRLLAGDWHGFCRTAIFYNTARHQSCPVWCGRQEAY
ncbi:MAG TPA: hypothetical protein VKW08_18740 [Xanthobacteraceae bacterium]|jgi:hypothetical protein|nr:hypothetical protein [Xanthobacteraceae bacterium]